MKPSTGFPVRLAAIFLLSISAPYFLAMLTAGSDFQFGGFLLNPIDGNTYLAKMLEGWRGDWRFTLPFSAEPGRGAYIFTYYLFLGHAAKWLNVSILFIYHLARLFSALFLVWAAWKFFGVTVSEKKWRSFSLLLALFGLGLGWVFLPSGVIISDTWVAEAYPFLSAYTNAHFPLTIGLVLSLLAFEFEQDFRRWKILPIIAATALLGSLSPFSWGLMVAVLCGLLIWEAVLIAQGDFHSADSTRRVSFNFLEIPQNIRNLGLKLIVIGGVGFPVVLYSYISIHHDPILAAWNAQNITLTPPIWDLILAFSPALILAVPGIWHILRTKEEAGRMLVVWFLTSLILIYLPFDLQRRFLSGFYIPMCGLAAYGLIEIEGVFHGNMKIVSLAVILLSIPTTILIIIMGQFGVWTHQPEMVLSKREVSAMNWLEQESPSDALILTSPRLGLFIPSIIGRRVIYGHPFETPNAVHEKEGVEKFFIDAAHNPKDARKYLVDRKVDYIFYVQDENNRHNLDAIPGLEILYNQDDALIYKVQPP